MSKILDKIHSLNDVKNLSIRQINALAKEIRTFLIENVSKTGGHLASNLGVVEMTLALHKVFNSPKDKIIWDVGHQSYVHKIITGRKDKFNTLRQYKGISGFPKRSESDHDIFETGHSSTSISAGLGMALARDIKGEKHEVISVIGDGAMTAGMAFEALNQAGDTRTKLIVVLNDNEMSISKNVGGLSHYLDRIRTAPTYFKMKEDVESLLNSIPAIGKKVFKTAEKAKDSLKYFLVPGIVFEEIGFKYLGPVDGHNISELIGAYNRAKSVKGPVIIHVVTRKGKGYLPAEKDPDQYHSASPFAIDTGKPLNKSTGYKYSNVFGDVLTEMAEEDDKIVAITAAMPSGTGLNKFKSKYSSRFFDVGIAEQHGVTLAAGLANAGLRPYYAVYSTFLQRGFDQVLHDVCIQNLPVTFAIDRAGLVGNDGETHHGVFDFSYLTPIPNITIMAPKDKVEFINMIRYSSKVEGPVALRYPRGYCWENNDLKAVPIEYGKGEILSKGDNIAIIAVGKMVEIAYEVINRFKEEGQDLTLVNGRFIKPLDEEMILQMAKEHRILITVEDNVISGGFGSGINDLIIKNNCKCEVSNLGIPDVFIEHGDTDILFEKYGLDVQGIYNFIKSKL